MAPSDGWRGASNRRKMNSFGVRDFMTSVAILLLHCHVATGAAIAKGRYFMDVPADCVPVGSLDIPRDHVTFVSVKADSNLGRGLACNLQFKPQESGDTLRMWFEKDAFIGNCDVSLRMRMTDNRDFTLGCRSGATPQEMEAKNGRGTLTFERKMLSSTTYQFTIGVQARRSVAPPSDGDSSTGDIGMIVGIVAGVIVLVVLLLILCVCCYRRSRRDGDFKVEDNNKPPVATFENGKINPQFKDYAEGSPSLETRLLSKSSSADYDVEEGLKPKSALDRFGPTPARRSERPIKSGTEKEHEEASPRNKDETEMKGSPILDALRKNPKFRRSFHDTEVDADDRANRISGSDQSSVSYNSNGVPLPPKLPPVPRSPQRSPSPQRRGEKIAAIFRARPSSSGSEVARQLGDPEESADGSASEFVPSPRRDDKDTRHVLRPNRNGRQSRSKERRKIDEEDESEEERKRKRKERDRKEEERERRRKQEEEEEEAEREEEERKRKKKEKERRRREEEEEEEEERRDKKRREKEREKEDERLEGRFKKSASGRRSKGKGNRMGRSKSTSNALDEMEDNYQRSRSKSPSSVRSLNFIEDDDEDDLDSNYMPFKRAGSKTSLYASRTSLYGRRRKNSMGETISLSSYAHDDMDSRYGDFDRKSLSRREKDRMFKSTGELEMHGATALVVRECATQTDSEKSVFVYGRKTLAKSRPGKMYSRGCQTGRARRDSTGSARSGRSSRMKKSRSQESLRKQKRSRSRNLDESRDSSDDRRSHHRSKSRLDDSYDSDSRSRRSRSRDLDDSDDDRRSRKKKHHRSKSRDLQDDDDDDRSARGKRQPKARPRKSTGAASVDLSESDDGRSVAASSVAPSSIHPLPPNPYGPQYMPVMYPGMTFLPTAPGGPPVPPGAAGPKPPIAPKPKKSKWDQLVEMTEGEKHRQHQRGGDSPTESMLTSVYSHHPDGQANYYAAPPSYTTAKKYPNPNSISSAYPDSSGMPMSERGGRNLKYRPSESEI